MEIFNQFYLTFANMDFFVALLLLAGVIAIVCEIFQPGGKALGVVGAILVVSSIVLRAFSLKEGEQLFSVIFCMIFVVSVIMLFSFIIMVRSVRYKWIKYSPDVRDESSEETDKRYSHLVGVEGVTLSTLRPVGTAKLCGSVYTVLTDGFFIQRGEKIKVHKIEKENIIVRKA
ncbi:MAG: hypothetical protein IJF76_02615 [Clostridia bacterium]|nr:hypothetical protein [Clostridia bacterium]